MAAHGLQKCLAACVYWVVAGGVAHEQGQQREPNRAEPEGPDDNQLGKPRYLKGSELKQRHALSLLLLRCGAWGRLTDAPMMIKICVSA